VNRGHAIAALGVLLFLGAVLLLGILAEAKERQAARRRAP
jgi:hypothetical protein